MTPNIASADFAFPAIAAQSLAGKGQPPDLTPWLEKIDHAMETEEESKGCSTIPRASYCLRWAVSGAAMAAFTEGAKSPIASFRNT